MTIFEALSLRVLLVNVERVLDEVLRVRQLYNHVVSRWVEEDQASVFLIFIAELVDSIDVRFSEFLAHPGVVNRLHLAAALALIHIERAVELVDDTDDFIAGLPPELTHVVEQSLTEFEVAGHVVLSVDHVVDMVLELEIPALVLSLLLDFLPLDADLGKFRNILVSLVPVILRHRALLDLIYFILLYTSLDTEIGPILKCALGIVLLSR